MKNYLNPFLIRTGDSGAGEADFLRFFSPSPLETLTNEGVLQGNKFFRSSPGGGKTTLLRLFTPKVLRAVYSQRKSETKSLYDDLNGLGVIDSDGPTVVGCLLSCANTFCDIELLDLQEIQKLKVFISLMNARILLTAIDSIVDFFSLEDFDQVDQISYQLNSVVRLPADLPRSGTLKAVLDWSSKYEERICSVVDSYDPHSEMLDLPGESLFAIELLSEIKFEIEGKPHKPHFLVMLDDLQYLAQGQRDWLVKNVIRSRYAVPIWFSERLDALDLADVVEAGDRPGRDMFYINLEHYWQTPKGKHVFEHMLKNIADKRAQAYSERDISSFTNKLSDALDEKRYENLFIKAAIEIEEKIASKSAASPRHKHLLGEGRAKVATPRERAIIWGTLGIILAREERKQQQTLDFVVGLEEFQQTIDSAVEEAAELFIHHDFKSPYYFGIKKLIQIASYNVEQFLFLSSRLFREITASHVLKGSGELISPSRQEEIIEDAIEEWHKMLKIRSRLGQHVFNFINLVGIFCNQQTYQLNAPYAPGVTGVGILMSEWEELCLTKTTERSHFAKVLKAAIANNLIEPRPNINCKHNSWMVLYLNRALCVRYSLPLRYGGWREWRLYELMKLAPLGTSSHKLGTLRKDKIFE